MKLLKLSGFIILISFLSLSCESVDEAQLIADDFYDAYNTENTDKMEALLDKESVIDAGINDQLYSVFDQIGKRSEGYKIFEYEYNIDKAVIDKTEN